MFSDYANGNPRYHFIFYQKLGSNTDSISNVHFYCFCKVTAATWKCSVCDYRIYSNKHPGRFLNIFCSLLYIFCVYWRGAFIWNILFQKIIDYSSLSTFKLFSIEYYTLWDPKGMKIHFQTYAISGICKGRYFKHREGTYVRVFMMYLYNSYMINWKIEQWNFARFVTLYQNKYRGGVF